MHAKKIIPLVTPFSILYLAGLGIVVYFVVFPGPEGWGLLVALYAAIAVAILFMADMVLRLLFVGNEKNNFILQLVLVLVLGVWILL